MTTSPKERDASKQRIEPSAAGETQRVSNLFSARLREAMRVRGMKQIELVRRTGIGKSSICQYLKGEYEAKQANVHLIADALDVNEDWLFGTSDEMERDPTALCANIVAVRRVPLLGGIAAGVPTFADQQYDSYVDADDDLRCDYALRIDGDSMEPTVRRGDMVFIRKQDDVENGQIAAVLIDDSATLKRVRHIKGGLLLLSDNAAYEPMVFTYPECNTIRILGKAVGFRRVL